MQAHLSLPDPISALPSIPHKARRCQAPARKPAGTLRPSCANPALLTIAIFPDHLKLQIRSLLAKAKAFLVLNFLTAQPLGPLAKQAAAILVV